MVFTRHERVVNTLMSVLVIFCFFLGKVLKFSNNYRCAFIFIEAFMNTFRSICTSNSTAESFVPNTKVKWLGKMGTTSSFRSGFNV